jgi:hypothetical protein
VKRFQVHRICVVISVVLLGHLFTLSHLAMGQAETIPKRYTEAFYTVSEERIAFESFVYRGEFEADAIRDYVRKVIGPGSQVFDGKRTSHTRGGPFQVSIKNEQSFIVACLNRDSRQYGWVACSAKLDLTNSENSVIAYISSNGKSGTLVGKQSKEIPFRGKNVSFSIGVGNSGRQTTSQTTNDPKLVVSYSFGIIEKDSEAKTGTMTGTQPTKLELDIAAKKVKALKAEHAAAQRKTLIAKYREITKSAKAQFDNKEYDKVVLTFSKIIDDKSFSEEFKNKARTSRSAALLGRGNDGDIDKAIGDRIAAGHLGVKLRIQAPTAQLKSGTTVLRNVRSGQAVLITKTNGTWFWVAAVEDNDKIKGWLAKKDLFPSVTTQPNTVQSNPAQQWTQPNLGESFTTQPERSFRSSGDPFIDNFIQTNGRPPTIWETPRWESPAEIRQLRSQGFIK